METTNILRTFTAPAVDITMLVIYTSRNGRQYEKMVPASKLHGEVRKISDRGGRSIKVL
jgi:hypothetical protein